MKVIIIILRDNYIIELNNSSKEIQDTVLQSLFSAGVWLYLKDKDGRVSYINKENILCVKVEE